jgi:hypothetical protein
MTGKIKLKPARLMIGVVTDKDTKARLTAAGRKSGLKLSPFCEAILKDHLIAKRQVKRETRVTE